MSSARAQPESEEGKQEKATKKVKTRSNEGGQDVNMEGPGNIEKPPSFREALMNVSRVDELDDFDIEWDDDNLPENRWYKEVDEQEQTQQKRPSGIPEIQITDKELVEWSEPWNQTLIINVMGKKVNYRALEYKLTKDWAKGGTIKIIDMPRGYYAVQFENFDDYKHALFKGPWMIADHYILVQRWRRNFLKSARVVQKVAVWIRIPELPLELYNDTFLKRLGAQLGMLLKIDRLTPFQHRGQFARICVEIDLAQPVVPQVAVRGELLNLEYEGLHTICFHCGVYGHREAECIRKVGSSEKMEVDGKKVDVSLKQQSMMVVESSKGDGGSELNVSTGSKGKEALSHTPVDREDVSEEVTVDEGLPKVVYGPWIVVSKGSKNKKRDFRSLKGDIPMREGHSLKGTFDRSESSRSHEWRTVKGNEDGMVKGVDNPVLENGDANR